MTLKELFEKSENGTLTYEQLLSAATAGNAKFVDLSEGKYVDRQKYSDDISSRDTRIKDLDDLVKTRDADLSSLRTQLESAGTDADKLNKVTTDLSELQKKYDKDTKAYEKQLKEQAYKHAVMDFANTQKFSSNAAKRDFVSTMLSKDFKVENDVIVGATDFVAAYSKENADAFVVEKEPEPQVQKPHFADTTKSNTDTGSNANMFNFGFTGVRPHDN